MTMKYLAQSSLAKRLSCQLCLALLLLFTVPSAAQAAAYYFDTAGQKHFYTSTTKDNPRGIYSIDKVVNQPYVDGVLIRPKWSDLEPTQGNYNFSKIDDGVRQAAAAEQEVTLAVLASAIPSWLVSTVPQADLYQDMKGRQMIVPWSTAQFDAYQKLITAVANHKIDGVAVKDHPSIKQVNASVVGTTLIRLLPTPPNYTYAKYESAVMNSLAAWAAAFPDNSKNLYVGLFAFSVEYNKPTDAEKLREKILDTYNGTDLPRMHFYEELLTGQSPFADSPNTSVLKGINGRVATMFQACGPWVEQTSSTWPCKWVTPLDTPLMGALHAMELFKTPYFEYYNADLENPEYAATFAEIRARIEQLVTPPSPAPTLSLSASSGSVAYNGSATLSWSSTNATSCVASGGWSGTFNASGSHVLANLTQTDDYILECTGTGGKVRAVIAVAVEPYPAPTLTLSSLATSVSYAESTTLSWESNYATACEASGAWSGSMSPNGVYTTSELTSDSNFTLTCTGVGGTTAKTVNIIVAPPPRPTLSLSADVSTASYNGTATLSWQASNATACIASGGWSGSQSPIGSYTTPALTANTDFTLTCSGVGGSVSDTVSIVVAAPVPTLTFSASSEKIEFYKTATLTWAATEATSCEASGAWSGVKSISGSAKVRTLKTSGETFTLTCTGIGGSVTKNVTIARKRIRGG